MSGIRIERAAIKNFKCRHDFAMDLKGLNIWNANISFLILTELWRQGR